MPKTWYDRHSIGQIKDSDMRAFYRNIVADKKPYFMRYIYQDLMKQYNSYIKNTNKNALREFNMSIDQLKEISYADLSDRQKEFLFYYDIKMPVSVGNCVMNKICRRFEEEFDGFVGRSSKESNFDYEIMKSNTDYSKSMYYNIRKIYEDFNAKVQQYTIFYSYEQKDYDEGKTAFENMKRQFYIDCFSACPSDDKLCNILLDLCYTKSRTKKFAWSMCSGNIINNLLNKRKNIIEYPTLCPDGDIVYCGQRYTIEKKEIKQNNEYCNE